MPRPKSPSAEGSEVGYCKLPVASRFKKGQSGNPAGRPRGSRGLGGMLLKALNAKVTITEGGRRVQKSKIEVAITQLVNKAATGDSKSMQMISALWPQVDALDVKQATTPDLARDREQARKLVERMAKTLADQAPAKKSKKGGKDQT